MQTRKKIFETNSSSTHSVVISSGTDFIDPGDLVSPVEIYPGEYGWEEDELNSWGIKASYAYTYAKNYGSDRDVEMLKNVLESYLKVEVEFKSNEDGIWRDGVIDHQSVDEAAKMFENEDVLKRAIFCHCSYIKTGNDN